MPLERRVITIPLGRGVDEGVDDKVLRPPYLAQSLNTDFSKEGGVSKRRGFTEASDTGLPATSAGLNSGLAINDTPLLYGRFGTYIYNDADDDWQQLRRSNPPVQIDTMGGIGDSGHTLAYDVATDGEVLLEVWSTIKMVSRTLMYRARSLTSGAVVVPATILDSGTSSHHTPRVMYTDGEFYLFSIDSTDDSLYFRNWDRATDTWEAPTLIDTDVEFFDICGSRDTAQGYVVWNDDTGTVAVAQVLNGTISDVTAGGAALAGVGPVAITQLDGVLVAVGRATGIGTTSATLAVKRFDASLTAGEDNSAALVITNDTDDFIFATPAVGITTSGKLFAALSADHRTDDPEARHFQTKWGVFEFDTGLPLFSEEFVSTNTKLSHRPFTPTDHNVCWGVEHTRQIVTTASVAPTLGEFVGYHPCAYLLELDEDTLGVIPPGEGVEDEGEESDAAAAYPVPLARFNYDAAQSSLAGTTHPHYLASTLRGTGTQWLLPSLYSSSSRASRRQIAATRDGETFNTSFIAYIASGRLFTTEFEPPPARSIPVPQGALINQGGTLLSIEGDAGAENDFLPIVPTLESLVDIPVTGGALSVNRRFRAVCVARDSSGKVIHRSAPSNSKRIETDLSTGAPAFGSLRFPDISLRRPNDSVEWFAAFYATEEGNVAEGPYHLLSENRLQKQPDGSFTFFASGYFTPPPLTLAENPQLYTEGGILENAGHPPLLDICTTAERCFAISAENRSDIWYSKLTEPGVALEWNPQLLHSSPLLDFVALAQLEDKVLALTDSAVYMLLGRGQDNTGRGEPMELRVISSDTGCLSRESVVSTPQGVMFLGKRGYYLVDRGVNLSYLGGPVEASLQSKTITAAVVVPELHEMRVTTTEGACFVYHYQKGTWSTRDGRTVHAFKTDSTYCTVDDSAGWTLWTENPANTASHTDDRVATSGGLLHNRMRVVTPWLIWNSSEGYARVWRILILGEYLASLTDSAMTVELFYDYDDTTVVDTYSFTAAQLGGAVSPEIRVRVVPSRPKCEALKIRVTEVQSGGGEITNATGEGFQLSGITLEVGVFPGRQRQHDPNNQL